MRIGASHLTYCGNMHPGETWPEVRANLQRFAPEVKRRVSPDRPFGLGLRLSAAAAGQLSEDGRMAELKAFLDDHGLYVFTVNGFPYGAFHGRRVKEKVYEPDWRDEHRLAYSDRLADLLAGLLPEGVEGSVSTVPGGFRAAAADPTAVRRMAGMLVRHVAHLAEIERRTGRRVALALEPEPGCLLETTAEAVAFFRDHLLTPDCLAMLRRLGDAADAEATLRRHLGLCIDLCHAAVMFEDAEAMLAEVEAAGLRVVKLQVTAGLTARPADEEARRQLARFDDGVYLHQVAARGPAGRRHWLDLPEALAAAGPAAAAEEWRVHAHVPLFVAGCGPLGTTRDYAARVLARHGRRPVSSHLEVETYTWDYLPAELRRDGVVEAIAGELRWVEAQLAHDLVDGA